MWNMYFQNAPWKACLTRERSCVVFTHWEQFFIPFWNLGVPTTQSCDSRNILKGHDFFIGLWEWHTISVSCVSAQDEKEDTRTRHPNNSGRWKGLKHLHLVCVLACRSANHSFQKNPLRCSCNPHLKTAKEGLSRARLRWREFSAYWKMWFASGKLQLLSPEQNLGAAEWKPFQTGRTSHTTEILIFVKSFNEQQKAKEWDKVGAPDHSP